MNYFIVYKFVFADTSAKKPEINLQLSMGEKLDESQL